MARGMTTSARRMRYIVALGDVSLGAGRSAGASMLGQGRHTLIRCSLCPQPHSPCSPWQPLPQVEVALQRIWARVLDLGSVPSVEADFFGLGGSSLRAGVRSSQQKA